MFFSETPNETTMCETLNERLQQPCETLNERLQQPCETLKDYNNPVKPLMKDYNNPVKPLMKDYNNPAKTHFLQAWTDIYIYKSASDKMPVFSDHFFCDFKDDLLGGFLQYSPFLFLQYSPFSNNIRCW